MKCFNEGHQRRMVRLVWTDEKPMVTQPLFTTLVNRKETLFKHFEPWTGWGTRVKEHIRLYSCHPVTGLLKIRQISTGLFPLRVAGVMHGNQHSLADVQHWCTFFTGVTFLASVYVVAGCTNDFVTGIGAWMLFWWILINPWTQFNCLVWHMLEKIWLMYSQKTKAN